VPGVTPPLAGVRVLDYAQYVAGPLATMLLADLGADVIKVEPPAGDAWRRYEPLADGDSRWFWTLNRGKRSVAVDLRTPEGRRESETLIRSADAVVHNLPAERALRFGLDREAVRAVNPDAVWCSVSSVGSRGPEAGRLAFDLIAQAMTGMLLADVREGDDLPRRSGGIAMADLAAGMLAAMAVVAGLAGRERGQAPGLEVSLLGAALAVQVQRFVRLEGEQDGPAQATAADLAREGRAIAEAEALDPYYRCYATADGYLALSCLNTAQRLRLLSLLGLDDPWAGNPQAVPADERERAVRTSLAHRFAERFAVRRTRDWVALLSGASVPAGEVRRLTGLFDDPQVRATGLVQSIEQPGFGRVDLLGGVVSVDGEASCASRPAPALDEHRAELLSPVEER
jgi:crotonobetainyl-CoA:carnitine CoA-transferase CaiB-like acyl-CoA transferase